MHLCPFCNKRTINVLHDDATACHWKFDKRTGFQTLQNGQLTRLHLYIHCLQIILTGQPLNIYDNHSRLLGFRNTTELTRISLYIQDF